MSLLISQKFKNYLISSDSNLIDINAVHHFLDSESYWAQGISLTTLQNAIAHSICLGVYLEDGTQIGFGRMITDRAVFAYLADVFVLLPYRGQGIAQQLMECFCTLGDGFGLRRFLLTTQDAHDLYRKSGFEAFPYPERLMSRQGVVYPQKMQQ